LTRREDVAASLGTPPWRVFFRVVLPQLKLAICGGALLVALHLLAEYGLYVMIRFDTFTTAFMTSFSLPSAARRQTCWRACWPCFWLYWCWKA
jgi:iron(III) transport system permease protein